MTSDVTIQRMKKFWRWQGMMSFQVLLFSSQVNKPSSCPEFCPWLLAGLADKCFLVHRLLRVNDDQRPTVPSAMAQCWVRVNKISKQRNNEKLNCSFRLACPPLPSSDVNFICKSYFTSTKSKGFITDLRHAHCHKLSCLWFKFKVKSKSHWI